MNNTFNLLIAGSRTLTDYLPIRNEVLDFLDAHPNDNVCIITGRASSGPDDIAYHLARWDLNLPLIECRADWDTHGKRAGMLRNITMLDQSDAVSAHWDGESLGTKHTITEAKRRGIPITIRVSDPTEFSRIEIMTLDTYDAMI